MTRERTIRQARTVAALVALIALVGCGGGAVSTAAVGSEAADAAVAVFADEGHAPDFTLAAVDGSEVSLSDTAGQVRLLDFWATWCAPCREEIPMLKELHEAYGDRGLQILAISEEDPDVIREFVEKYDIPYPNLVGTGDLAQQLGVFGLPTAYLVDGNGRILESFQGAKPKRVLEAKIVAALDSPS